MPGLMELNKTREELNTKREQLHKIFADAGEEIKMDAATVDDVRARNTEINELTDKFKSLTELIGIKDSVSEPHKFQTEKKESKGGDVPEEKSMGRLFVDSDAFKNYSKGEQKGPSITIDLDAINADFKTLLTTTGFAPQAVRSGRVVEGALTRPVVADLIPDGTTQMNAIVYMEETTTTNGTTSVAEGAAKPESALAFTERTAAVRKNATVLPVTDELMSDVPAMRSYVEARLRLFLSITEEVQLLNGDGIAPNILGLMNASGVQTQAKGTDPTPDAIYKAMVLIQTNSFLDPSGVILNPLDWQDIRLLRTADGIYIWGSPSDVGVERIWGLPVVKTTAQTVNTGLVGAFETATQLFRRNEVTFAVSDQHNDFFIQNKLMLRVEERLALAIYRGSGLCKVTGI